MSAYDGRVEHQVFHVAVRREMLDSFSKTLSSLQREKHL